MDGQNSAPPVIIKRKKTIVAGGHHGGAWKVAYADFVTAMMAFFMLMWLLNATTEKQRKGIADYFSPTIPVNRVSGGGEGAFGGESVFSEDQIAQTGTGASRIHPTTERQSMGTSGAARSDGKAASSPDAALKEVQTALMERGGESATLDNLMKHVLTRVTDQGLIVEIYDLSGSPLFEGDSTAPTEVMKELAAMIAEVFDLVGNQVAVGGHVKSYPVVLRNNPTWPLSTGRAQVVRDLLEKSGLDRGRIQRVTGFADRKPAVEDRAANRNNRIELTLLRDRT